MALTNTRHPRSQVALGFLVLLFGGCASTGPAKSTTPAHAGRATSTDSVAAADASSSTTEAPTWALSAAATFATEEEAYRSAKVRLIAAALGLAPADEDAAFYGPLLDAVHERGEAGFEVAALGNEVRVTLGITETQLPALYRRLEAAVATWHLPTGPGALQVEAEAAVRAGLADALCQRQRAVSAEVAPTVSSACQAQAPRRAETTIKALGTRIHLAGAFALGVPTSKEGAPLRPARVTVTTVVPGNASSATGPQERVAVPLEGLTVRFTQPNVELAPATTDERGVATATYPASTPFIAPLQASLDLRPWLGPFAAHAETGTFTLRPHALDDTRAMVLWSHRGSHDPRRRAILLRAIQPRVRKETTPGPERLTQLPTTDARALAARLPAWVDGQPSPPDVVLLAETQSEFASRMGTQRVWYEARGRLITLNAWTGETMGELTASVTESGLGEQRAEQAAIDALLKRLGEQWLAASGQ